MGLVHRSRRIQIGFIFLALIRINLETAPSAADDRVEFPPLGGDFCLLLGPKTIHGRWLSP